MNKNGKYIRDLESDWCEFISLKDNRKYYFNKETKEYSWKPPRKTDHQTYWTFDHENDNVGGILRMGELYIAKLPFQNHKTKWKKSYVFLSYSHFGFKTKNKKDKPFEKINLAGATVTKDKSKKNKYCVTTLKTTVLFKGKNSVEVESWFHAMETVIENLQEKKNGKLYQLNGNFFVEKKTNSFSFKTEIFESDAVKRDIDKRNSLRASMKAGAHKESEDILSNTIKNDEIVNFKFPCPPNWNARFDVVQKQYLYENIITQDVCIVLKDKDGKFYFKNTKTGYISWLLPSETALRSRLSCAKETSI